MTTSRLLWDSMTHYRRASLAVALGVAVGTAVLTGALLVGDSVRGSLRRLVLDRLGNIDCMLVVDRFFRSQLADELSASSSFKRRFDRAVPAIVLEATIESAASGARVNRVNLLGAQDFAALGPGGPARPLRSGQIALNAPLAGELGVNSGDEIILRLPSAAEIPRDSPLGRKTETIRNRRLLVSEILPQTGLAGFSARPNQQMAMTAFVPPETVQTALEEPGRVNAILVTAKHGAAAPTPADDALLQDLLRPKLSDYGLRLEETARGYFNLTSQRMVLEPAVERAALAAYPKAQPVLTYLANTIAAGEREIPYSTVSAMDPATDPPLGPFTTTTGETLTHISDDEIVLNEWAANDLQAQPGDKIKLVFFKPESTHGATEETSAEFRLAAVVKLAGAAADPDLTPTVKGITDEKSIADWDPPFPFDAGRVRSEDEAYWDQYRGTPKAFVSLATGRRIWGSRFGDATSIRIQPGAAGRAAAAVASRWKIDATALGFAFRPVRRLGLAAAAGTTPFNILFLGFSMFIILAALMLIALLFRLSVEGRAAEIGTLYATGWPARRVRRLWLVEGLVISSVGAVVGLGLALGYAWLMLTALNTWWVDAIASPFVRFYATPASLAEGYLGGVAMALVAIAWSLRGLAKVEVRRLLAGGANADVLPTVRARRWTVVAVWLLLAMALVTAVVAARLNGEAQAGAFLSSGTAVLLGFLLLSWNRLQRDEPRASGNTSPLVAVPAFALRNGARHPMRSILSIGLVAVACFLIVAISAFRLAPPRVPNDRGSGTGGFIVVAESNQPIYQNLNDPSVLATSGAVREVLRTAMIYQVRVRAGDDASCLNLYQPSQPRMLGMPSSFLHRGGFEWAGTLAQSTEEKANPWLLLAKDYPKTPDGRDVVPVVIDAATAQYSLHAGDLTHPGGLGTIYELPGKSSDRATACLIVGLLKNSMLQGDLITSDAALLRAFPDTSGYRFFLIDCPTEEALAIESALEVALGDYGFDARLAVDRLAGFMVVQNSYLSTFQSLGAFGLLLGTIGLAIVELRNVLERRGELALLRAVGFPRRMLAWLVLCENLVLLIAGLLIGLVAAAVAVSPHLVAGDAAIPWRTLLLMFALVVLAAVLSSLAAVRAMLRATLVAALRGD